MQDFAPKNISWNCLGLKFRVKFHNFFDPISICIEWENLTWLKTNFPELKRPKILNFKSISRNFANKFQMCTLPLKFIYSEKATKFCEISTVDLSYVVNGLIYGGDFAKFCGLLRIYKLYISNMNTLETGLTRKIPNQFQT